MSDLFIAPTLSSALKQFKQIVKEHIETGGKEGKPLVVFCEDRLSLIAERALCEACAEENLYGTFAVSVHTLSRFMSSEGKLNSTVLTKQGSAMAIKKIIEENKGRLQLFKRLSSLTAAQDVYDTLALLFSCKIDREDLLKIDAPTPLLKRKVHDLQLIYGEYENYLKEKEVTDRNFYLRELPDIIKKSEKIKKSEVLFFGFQAFTASVAGCVEAAYITAKNTSGIFIGGREKKYVNEAYKTFKTIVGGCREEWLKTDLTPAAEVMRERAFEPEGYHKPPVKICGEVHLLRAADREEECAYIASQILKNVKEDVGVRYREISVMLPDLNGYQPTLERVFTEYGIPFYVDRRYPLITHPVCTFILNYLTCVIDGGFKDTVISVVSSPLFKAEGNDKDNFVNYLLRLGNWRGAAEREVDRVICASERISYEAADRVRTQYIKGYAILKGLKKADGGDICSGIVKLLEAFDIKGRLEELATSAEESKLPSYAAMSRRAYASLEKVIEEARKLTSGEDIELKEFIKIFKTGLSATEVSLIQPKQDEVFVCDVSSCINAGSKVLFAAGLSDAVPLCALDTSILTDAELTSLEKFVPDVSPKISQVNARVREVTALNLCAFSKRLYMLTSDGGDGDGADSEAMMYARHIFTEGDGELALIKVADAVNKMPDFAYYYSRPHPAEKRKVSFPEGKFHRAVEGLVQYFENEGALSPEGKDEGSLDFDRTALYGKVSPTALEQYFSCPYKAFMQRGLMLDERREASMRPLDVGVIIHYVLQETAKNCESYSSAEECSADAGRLAKDMFKRAEYAVPEGDACANYSAEKLIEEVKTLAAKVYDQLKNSRFKVDSVEKRCSIILPGVIIEGRVDRVDYCGDMVRVIDYKTGKIDDSAPSYYMGLKLQLPLYLSAVSESKRAVGAYYFPAGSEYTKEGAEFSLEGFMDGSEEVVKSSDINVQEKERSKIVGAYLNGRPLDRVMSKEDFAYFLSYSKQIAQSGAEGLVKGKISPSPVKGECEHCPYGGCCGFDGDVQSYREKVSAKCAGIAAAMRKKDEGEK